MFGVGGKRVIPSIRMGTELLYLQQSTETATVHVLGQDGHGQQFDTTCSLISVPQWHRMVKSKSTKQLVNNHGPAI